MSKSRRKRREPAVEETEQEQGLLLRLPLQPATDMAERLTEALATGVVQGVVAPAGMPREAIDRAGALVRAARIAFLVGDDAVLAIECGADGVMLANAARLDATRTIMGAQRPIGIACGLSRHAAMVAGEDGADYILAGALDGSDPVEPTASFVRWWTDVTVLPCAVICPTHAAAAILVEAGADMLVPPDEIWSLPAGILPALAPYLEALPGRGR